MEDTSGNKEDKLNGRPFKHICIGVLAHVDAGKTTLSEAMLYSAGNIRRMGRVDKGDAFLDTFELEKKRGITIFSKQAVLRWGESQITLLDTPGHVDFSAEMERTLQVLDYAVLVISGTDGVQGHTRTLWRLLARYRIPVFLFINKMDLAGSLENERKNSILKELSKALAGNFVDFGESGESFYENIAVCGESALEQFFETGLVELGMLRSLIRERSIFPCFFGSALKLWGVEDFLNGMDKYMEMPDYPAKFGARVFKIARDAQGGRLTYMKITGGVLKTRDLVGEEKVNQIRIYSGDKYETVQEARSGDSCAVTGLLKPTPGQGLGFEEAAAMPVLEPVLACRVDLPEGTDVAAALPKLRQLEEEEPELHITWEEERQEIHAQIMGEIQMEVLKSLIEQRFGIKVGFGDRSILYKETIENTVEGIGHFEPLKHYAEVHLLLEPGEPGSGLQFASACSEDALDRNWQRLILTHLEEREHKGVLTGSPVTDMKITLAAGRAHKKHTEGGDFRQAVYRAVRQGLMKARSVLLEPYYDFRLEIPEKLIGRAMSDLERMHGTFEPPSVEGEQAVLTGSAPVALMDGYQREVAGYTGGTGRLSCTLKGYKPCHNTDEVIAARDYEPESDAGHPSCSVFCAHGAGFVVKWDQVEDYMHLESCLPPALLDEEAGKEQGPAERGAAFDGGGEEPWIGTDEVDAILKRTFYANSKEKDTGKKSRFGKRNQQESIPSVRVYKKEDPREKYLLVDGYNIIFAWEELRDLADANIDSARGKLLDILCNYQAVEKCHTIAVFDAYRVQGHATEFLDYHNIHVVYTREAETADQYIEKFAHENGKKYDVTVATSDRLEQVIILGQGCRLMSARELEQEIRRVGDLIRQECENQGSGEKRYLLDELINKEELLGAGESNQTIIESSGGHKGEERG